MRNFLEFIVQGARNTRKGDLHNLVEYQTDYPRQRAVGSSIKFEKLFLVNTSFILTNFPLDVIPGNFHSFAQVESASSTPLNI